MDKDSRCHQQYVPKDKAVQGLASIVRDSLPATALDTVFMMIARYVKYLKEVQSENKLPSTPLSTQDYVLPIKNFNKKMASFNSIAHPVKHTCCMTTL